MPIRKDYLGGSIFIAMCLCAAQITGNKIILLCVFGLYLLFLAKAGLDDYTLPILLFFIPWSTVMVLELGENSFYTIGLMLAALISMVKTKFVIKRLYVLTGILLLLISLIAKLINGYFIALNYLAFILLFFVAPVMKEEYRSERYDLYVLVVFLSLGAFFAALCAKYFGHYQNLSKFVKVHSYLNIRRMMGFYKDPNFYVAQIVAALGGCFYLLLRQREKKRMLILAALIVALLYCGALSGSKSFAVVTILIVWFWAIELVKLRGRKTMKLIIAAGAVILAISIARSDAFKGLIDVILTRFSFATDLDTFTTGRISLWDNYFHAILGDVWLLLIGQGYTNVLIGAKATHNSLLQAVYQFGIIGFVALFVWEVFFYIDSHNRGRLEKGQVCNALILLTGVFMPWMTIDILFFDEFFLFQMYVFVGLQEIRVPRTENILAPVEKQRRKKRVRIIWR